MRSMAGALFMESGSVTADILQILVWHVLRPLGPLAHGNRVYIARVHGYSCFIGSDMALGPETSGGWPKV